MNNSCLHLFGCAIIVVNNCAFVSKYRQKGILVMSMNYNKQTVFWLKSNGSYLNLLWKDKKVKKSKGPKVNLDAFPELTAILFLLTCFCLVAVTVSVGAGITSYLMEIFPSNADTINILGFILSGMMIPVNVVAMFIFMCCIDSSGEKTEEESNHYIDVKLTKKIKEALRKELNIQNGEEIASRIHYALAENTPYRDKITAALYGFREVKELNIKDEKQLEEANMKVFSLVIEAIKLSCGYKLEIKKAEDLEREQKRKELAEKELKEKEEKDFLLSQTLRNIELEFDSL